ncbi:MAG: Hpt domain-containing protein, partial [Bacteroidales bacterium]|nr:Hpt domain-containing protein [Bacteroidales bacterium]
MDTYKEKEFQKRLLATFKIEAAEHVEAISSGILNLEKANDAMQVKGIVEIVFREAHSLKGAARAVNMEQIENICKLLESVFMLVKQEQLQLDPTAYDRMHLSLDFITGLLESSEEMGIEDGNGEIFFGLLDKLEEIIEGETIKTDQPEIVRINEPINEPEVVRKQHQETPVQKPSSETQPTKETIRVPILKLDAIMRQAEELISLKLKLAQHNIDLNGQQIQLGKLKKSVQRKLQIKEKSISGSGSKKTRELVLGDHEGRKMSKSLINDIYQELCLVESNMSFIQEIFDSNLREVGSQVNHLMHDVRQTLMMPCTSLTELLPKLVRELSRDQGKEARLEIFGDEYELDRRIIERLKDPMIHLIRNAIDHGLEKPEERMQKGKSREGLIRVYITPAGGNILEFSITDDGKGFDLEAVRTEIAKSTE